MKKINSLLLMLLFSSTTLMAQVNLKSGLVACYPFNTNANDESGNNNDGTINGATLATDRFGKVNSAYSFNGTSDYIEVNAEKLQNPTFSYSMWVKPKSLPQSGVAFFIFSVGSDSGDQVIGLNNGYTNGTDGFTGGGYVAVGENAFCQKGSLPSVNQWYHVVLVRDEDTYKVYVDGSLMCSTTTITKPPFYGTGVVKATIGSRNNYGQFADCVLDDIHLYNRAINADEVKALFNGNTPQTITIASNNLAPCGGDNITFTANGATNTSKYQWKVDNVNQGTNSKTFDYTSTRKIGNYSVKISVEVTDEEVCFPQKSVITQQNITIKDCSVNLKNGLVACYPFNANAKDESSNGNDGTVNGAILTTDRFGKANSAYNFNGSSSIALPSDKFAFNEFSYAVWINISINPTFGDAYRILSIGGNCGDQDINIGNNYFAGNNGLSGIGGGGYNISTPTTNSGVVAGTLPTVGQWYHGVITRDKNEIKLYVNGVFVSSVSTNGTLPYYGCDGTVFANIGTRSTQVQSFVGNIDDLHIYNRAINADEVKALYDGNTPQTITITSSKSAPCGGDNIVFTADGGSSTSKYQWKVDGVNQGTNSKTFDYTLVKKTVDYTVKISIEVTDEEICFPQKSVITQQNIIVKDCTPSTGVNLKKGLVACYPFNSNANDESSNGNDGVVNGATLTTDRFGKANSAYNFNGSSLISVSPNQFKNQSYTYATWVYLDNLPADGNQYSFISVGGTGGDQVLSLASGYQALSANGFNCAAYNSGTPTVSSNWTGTQPNKNKWYHVAYTRDNTSIKLYVDGQLITNTSPNITTNETDPNYAIPTYVTIGARGAGFQFMQGSLDDIHLYNRAINADEVKALYGGNTPQTITITSNNSALCGGENITFTATGASVTAKYQWTVNDIKVGIQTTSNTFSYNSPTKLTDYQVKISVEISDDEICFPNKIASKDAYFNIKNCTLCVNSLLACYPFYVIKTK